MHRTIALAGALALHSCTLAQANITFDVDTLPFLDADSGAIDVELGHVRMSADGSTVYGSVIETFADADASHGLRRDPTAWRWRDGVGFEVLDLSGLITYDATLGFGRPTRDGDIVQVWSSNEFGQTNAILTPEGPRSGWQFTGSPAFQTIQAISADGSSVVRPTRLGFAKWSADAGERSFYSPTHAGVGHLDDLGQPSHLSADGSRTVGFSAALNVPGGLLWIHDEQDGFTTITSDNGWLAPQAISDDASVIIGQRILESDGTVAVFIWDEHGGVRDLTPEGVDFGGVYGMSGDGRVIVYEYIEDHANFSIDTRLFIDGEGDFELHDGLRRLGFDLDGLEIAGAFDFSSDALAVLASDTDGSFTLLRSSVPAPGTLVLIVAAFRHARRIRR